MAPVQPSGQPEIANFYEGKSIFVTGGTGFLGKLLVETLARCCPGLKKIYLLSRAKKGKTMEERIAEQFAEPLYEYVRLTNPEVLSRVVLMSGDSRERDLGLSNADVDTLTNEVNIVFHMAATVRFDEELRQAVAINVRSTRDLLLLADRMTHLTAFIHVSTAFANCVHKTITEEFYKPPVDGDKLIEIMEAMTDVTLKRITAGLLGDFPNTYTYTKCVAEDLVRKYSAGLPMAMVRPAIVSSTFRGNCPGWNDNLYGPNGMSLGIATGIVHVTQSRGGVVAPFIPANYVINAIIAAAWHIGVRYKHSPVSKANSCPHEIGKVRPDEPSADVENRVMIYNSVTTENSVTWGLSCKALLEYSLKFPSNRIMYKPFHIFIENKLLFTICTWLLHWIPAYIIDSTLKLTRQKPMLVNLYKKIHKFQSALAYFANNEWNFPAESTRQLYEKLSNADKVTFDFDVQKIDWLEYAQINYMGMRKYILKEEIPAHRRLFLVNVAHYLLCALLFFGLYKLLGALLSYITYKF